MATESTWPQLYEKPPGLFTVGISKLARMVTLSHWFINWVGVENEAEAQKHVFLEDIYEDGEAGNDLQSARPFAAVWPADEFDLSARFGGAKNWLFGGGQLVLCFTDRDRYPGDLATGALDFYGRVDGVISDLTDIAGRDDHLDVRQIQLLRRPMRSSRRLDPSNGGGYRDVFFLVTWGGRG